MLEPILQGLREVEGVQGAMVIDRAGQVLAQRTHAIYDPGVVQQVARAVISSVDAIELVQDDWEQLTAHFGEGKLVLRSLRVGGGRPRRYALAVITDGALNVASLGGAIRVAAGKLIAELEALPPTGSGPIPTLTGLEIGAADAASSAFLSACTKALATSLGPLAKVFVKEAVRKVCGERAFTRADGPALIAQLSAAIDDTDDRAMFQRATRAL